MFFLEYLLLSLIYFFGFFFFFFNDTATTEIYTLSLHDALPILADVTRLADCRRMASETANQLGGIDVLVNNAGIIAVGAVVEMAEEAWDRVMAVNAKGPFLCAKACIPYLQRNREGAIVNTASIAGKTGRGFVSAYCASKFAVVAFTQSLAEELGPSNIRVNAVCPGLL